jgi:hypothetical protein
MLRLIASIALVLCLGAAPALAQSEADTDATVDSVLGDHNAYRAAFDAIQQAVGDGDAAGFARWVSYPIKVVADGEDMLLSDEEQFTEHYDNILTDEIRQAILDQAWASVLVNADGIMLGNGQVWMNGICKNDSCSEFDVKIVTIQSAN